MEIRTKTNKKFIIQMPRKINNAFVSVNDECCSVLMVSEKIPEFILYLTTPFVNKTPKTVKRRTIIDNAIRKSGAKNIDFALYINLNDDVNNGLMMFNLFLI